MDYLHLERQDGVLVVAMARPKANAIHSPMLDELRQAMREGESDPEVRAVVLCSALPRFFSAGFDAQEIFSYGREPMREFFGRFLDLYHVMLDLPKPVAGAVGGHAMAGGAVLALACDVLAMADANYGFGLNEIKLGLVLPPGILRMAIRACGVAHARRLALTGETISPQTASVIGVAHELTPPDRLIERARARALELAAKPPQAFGSAKRTFRHLLMATRDEDLAFLDTFLDHWCSGESIERRNALAASLGSG